MMRFIAALVLAWLTSGPARADDDAWAALAKGAIGLIRHGATDGSQGDPPGFKLDDCATQRNLTPAGRRQIEALGEAVRRRGVAVGRVLTSPWCRTRDTATLLGFGPVEDYAPLSNLLGRYEASEAQIKELRPLIASWRGPGALILVSHGSLILPVSGVHPQEGEIVVVEPRPGESRGLRVVGRIPAPR